MLIVCQNQHGVIYKKNGLFYTQGLKFKYIDTCIKFLSQDKKTVCAMYWHNLLKSKIDEKDFIELAVKHRPSGR